MTGYSATMSNDSLPVLTGKRVTLRRPREEDFAARLQLGADAEIFRMYGGSRNDLRPMTEEAARRWVRRLIGLDYAWVIEAGALIGQVRLDPVELRDKRAVLAIGIDDSAQLGKGLGSEAVALVLGYGFNVLKLHRISLRVAAYNLRAIRAYRKCGFAVEGRERETVLVDGIWYDDMMMGILDREYAELERRKA
jgi:RimJ/RimL family protein N-acetyltransferase